MSTHNIHFRKKYMSHVTRKPDFCIYKNKGADQLCGNRTADQRLCFLHTGDTIPLLAQTENFIPLTMYCVDTALFD